MKPYVQAWSANACSLRAVSVICQTRRTAHVVEIVSYV